MIYLALGAVLLTLFVWSGRSRKILKRREWRFIAAAFSIVTFAGAAVAGLRGAWAATIVLLVLGLWSAATTRQGAAPTGKPPSRDGRMSAAEARSILGVGPDATTEDIQAAYSRLMRLAHPDKGGTAGLAAQLNAARDRLLRG